MPQICAAVGCKHKTPKCRLKRFPSDPVRATIWQQNLRRINWQRKPNDRLCQCHFDDDQFELRRQDGQKKLRPDAIPLIFPTHVLVVHDPTKKEKWHCPKPCQQSIDVKRNFIEDDITGDRNDHRYAKQAENSVCFNDNAGNSAHDIEGAGNYIYDDDFIYDNEDAGNYIYDNDSVCENEYEGHFVYDNEDVRNSVDNDEHEHSQNSVYDCENTGCSADDYEGAQHCARDFAVAGHSVDGNEDVKNSIYDFEGTQSSADDHDDTRNSIDNEERRNSVDDCEGEGYSADNYEEAGNLTDDYEDAGTSVDDYEDTKNSVGNYEDADNSVNIYENPCYERFCSDMGDWKGKNDGTDEDDDDEMELDDTDDTQGPVESVRHSATSGVTVGITEIANIWDSTDANSSGVLKDALNFLQFMLPHKWIALSEDGGIQVILLSKTRAKAIQRSVFISLDGSELELYVHTKRLPGDHKIFQSLSPSVPLTTDSVGDYVDRIINIIELFSAYEICCGVNSVHFLRNWRKFDDCLLDCNSFGEEKYVKTVRSSKCSLIAPKTFRRCFNCDTLSNKYTN